MENRTCYFLTIWFFILNLLDAFITISLVVDQEIAIEVNPLMEHLLQLGPWSVFFSTKMSVGWLFCYTVLQHHRKSPIWTKRALIFAVTIYNLAFLKHMWIILNAVSGL